MKNPETQISFSQWAVKFFLWCLRRPIPVWFVLLFGIWTFAAPAMQAVSHWDDLMLYFGPVKFGELFIGPFICLAACVLAFCLRKESIAFLLIYFVFQAIYIFQLYFDNETFQSSLKDPVMWARMAAQIFLWAVIFMYLLYLRKTGKFI